jgi:hypothetical protein
MDYKINDQIEDLNGPALDFPVAILEGDSPIISVKSFIYGFNHQEKWNVFHETMLDLTRSNILNPGSEIIATKSRKLLERIEKLIVKGPTVNYSFTVYRGIAADLCDPGLSVGDILINTNKLFPVLFTTLSPSDAKFYAFHDTAECYSDGYIDIDKAKPRDKGIILVITVPPQTHFFEVQLLDKEYLENETVFSASTRLVVTAIIEGNTVHCTIQ